MWLVDWLMIMNLCFELLAVAVGLAAIAVNFLNSLMIVCCTRSSTLDRCEGSADFEIMDGHIILASIILK